MGLNSFIFTQLPHKKKHLFLAYRLSPVSVHMEFRLFLLKLLPINVIVILTKLFNLYISVGIFTFYFKKAKVILKKRNPKQVENYCPINILSVFSNILEKIVHQRLFFFCSRMKILSNSQFGFRKSHSTSHACTHNLFF